MKETRSGKRYYTVGEKVFIKETKSIGVIKELRIKPQEMSYKAVVMTTEIVGKKTVVTTQEYNLWEIDKEKKTMYRDARKQTSKKDEKQPTILFAKVIENAKIPSKREEDGAFDIYACFEGDALIIPKVTMGADDEYIYSKAHPLVPTGIASSVTSKWRINLKNERGSVGKYKVLVLSGLIDSGYRGEWFVNLAPLTKDLIISKVYPFEKKEDGTPIPVETNTEIIYPYELAIAQAKLEYSPNAKTVEIPYEELKAIPSQRGVGALGSSNK